MRSARPSPSSASAPSGRCGPCTSSGEQVTSTTARARSSASNWRLVSVSQRSSFGSVFHLRLPSDPRSQTRIGMIAATINAIQAASIAAIASRLREAR